MPTTVYQIYPLAWTCQEVRCVLKEGNQTLLWEGVGHFSEHGDIHSAGGLGGRSRQFLLSSRVRLAHVTHSIPMHVSVKGKKGLKTSPRHVMRILYSDMVCTRPVSLITLHS